MEYLAGRRLGQLPFHQSRSLLASTAGWEAGVAGPLRETAAFAASHSLDVAKWIAATDPEVIGLSDVAADEIRRIAVLGLFEECRRQRLTDAQFFRDGIPISGLYYHGAEDDLRLVLNERGSAAEDVLECAIRMIREWKLTGLDDDLVDLMLDDNAPIESRKDAGYVLEKSGSKETGARLKVLLKRSAKGKDEELNGIVLSCNWPENLSTRELMSFLSAKKRTRYRGSYDGFMWKLVKQGFDASDCLLPGLKWARSQINADDAPFSHSSIVARRIIHAALNHLNQPAIAKEFIEILREAVAKHSDSPLGPINENTIASDDDDPIAAPLEEQTDARRQVIDHLIDAISEKSELRWVATETPGLANKTDFEWLLDRACDETRPLPNRTRYTEFVWFLSWQEDRHCVELWLDRRSIEPIASILNVPLLILIDSPEATEARSYFESIRRRPRSEERKVLNPPPVERVTHFLELAETNDPLFFRRIVESLTLKPESTHFEYERFLTRSPGWSEATQSNQQRIVKSAQAYLTSNADDPIKIRRSPINSIHTTGMAAVFLVLEITPDWLANVSIEWWERWAWYLLKELHPQLHGELEEPKVMLFNLLHARAAHSIRKEVLRLASGRFTKQREPARSVLRSLLEMLTTVEDAELDRQLGLATTTGKVPASHLLDVAQFVLHRAPGQFDQALVDGIKDIRGTTAQSKASQIVLALLCEQPTQHWDHLLAYVRKNPNTATSIMGTFADRRRLISRQIDGASIFNMLGPQRMGELAELLFELFPPDTDPRHQEARFMGNDDEARQLREGVLNWLNEIPPDEPSSVSELRIKSLRNLEKRFGSKFPWLRRPRARAERAFRLTHSKAVPIATVADLLYANDRRLMRSDKDVLDGIEAALTILNDNLQRPMRSDLRSYWNTPHGEPPSPKEEEHISDKMCEQLRSYFGAFAVVADREVQLARRQLPKSDGGAPGSEADVFVTIPAIGAVKATPIYVPIEVKLACNTKAKIAIKDQLADRYMSQVGSSVGVFVVAWHEAPTLQKHHRPLWASIEDARADLVAQALDLSKSDGLDIRVVIIDLTLK